MLSKANQAYGRTGRTQDAERFKEGSFLGWQISRVRLDSMGISAVSGPKLRKGGFRADSRFPSESRDVRVKPVSMGISSISCQKWYSG